MALFGVVACRTPDAPAPSPAPVAATDPALDMLTPTGWASGQKASGTADTLGAVPPVDVPLPAAVATKITGPTGLFYFSPTCPHCQDVMPELNALAASGDLRWIGIAHSRSTPAQLAEFSEAYKPAFPILLDEGGVFGASVGARSTPSVYVVEPLPAGTQLPDGGTPAPHTMRFVEAYTPFARGMSPLLRLRRHPTAPFASFNGYQGDVVCGACHTQEADAHELTMHRRAYHTLYNRDRADDPACVGCHVTGMSKTGQTLPGGGFVLGDHGSPLARVGCEACHGPSGPHDGQVDSARASCATCHDAEHSINFTLAKGLPLIDHYAAVGLSEAQMQVRLDELASGERARPLLAFPDGPTAGSKACQSCHKAQHKWWSGSTHSRAMTTLQDAKVSGAAVAPVDAPACVACHATQQSYGMAAARTAVSDFRTDEGVGCESCHGPGVAHSQAPRKDNIVGLGDSCPECVIEAVCTSCHTQQWDPGWELQTRLKAIAH
jgi:thiol-disulfide isomerase/thioredoxin